MNISEYPLRHVSFEIFVEIAVIINYIHFLMNCLNLMQKVHACRSFYTLDHHIVNYIQICSKYDVEIDRTGELLEIVPTYGVKYI